MSHCTPREEENVLDQKNSLRIIAHVREETEVCGDRSLSYSSSSLKTSRHVFQQINFNVTILSALAYPVSGPQLI